jgi:Ca2+-binding RTX toxin-like protein
MRIAVALIVMGVALVGGFLAAPPQPQPGYTSIAAEHGTCDPDGVTVGYATTFSSSPAPAGYRVTDVRVGGISSACLGTDVSVALTQAGAELATGGPVEIAGDTTMVPMRSPPLAQAVDGVRVAISGATGVPVPGWCLPRTFDSSMAGSVAAERLVGTALPDLIVGLAGDDELVGLGGGDCLAGQSGHDVLIGGSGGDVLLGGAGSDILRGGRGRDALRGGTGVDTCHGGRGRDSFVSCEKVSGRP